MSLSSSSALAYPPSSCFYHLMSRPSTASSTSKPSSRFSTLKVFKFAGSKPPPLPPKDPYFPPNPSLPSLNQSFSETSTLPATTPIYAQYANVPRSPSPSPSYATSRVTVSPPTSTFASAESSGSRKTLLKLPSFMRRPRTPRTSDTDGSSMLHPQELSDDPSISLPWNVQVCKMMHICAIFLIENREIPA